MIAASASVRAGATSHEHHLDNREQHLNDKEQHLNDKEQQQREASHKPPAGLVVKSRDSLLTTSSGYTNYRGILNLVIILLVLSNARAALENIIKYGILVDPLSWFLFLAEGPNHWPALCIVLGQSLHVLLALALEKFIALVCQVAERTLERAAASKKQRRASTSGSPGLAGAPNSQRLLVYGAQLVILANLLGCLALPPVLVYAHDTHPISTSCALMLVSCVFLKLVSYHMMNFWARDLRRPESEQSRTTRSFLRAYVSPAADFSADRLAGLAAAAKASLSGGGGSVEAPAPTATAQPQGLQEALGTTLNSQLQVGALRRRAPAGATSALPTGKENELAGAGQEPNNNNGPLKQSDPSEKLAAPEPGQEHGSSASASASAASAPPSASACAATSHHQHELVRQLNLESLAKYPRNLSLRDIAAFMAFPTLCYELEFARTQRIRKRFLIKRCVELLILSQLDIALVQQWIVPTVSNSMLPFRQMQLSHMLERLLKLAIPNHVIWLIWFYLFFHSSLNIVAELTRFADRQFYRDWWNSESVYYFWSNWNLPVHKWCARHLYVPLMSLGLNKCQASAGVFFVSAFFHEYLVSVPLKLFRMWAFTGMLVQLPWARFVSSYFNNHFANVAVWVSLIIGQPLCILMYYHDYYVINNVASNHTNVDHHHNLARLALT